MSTKSRIICQSIYGICLGFAVTDLIFWRISSQGLLHPYLDFLLGLASLFLIMLGVLAANRL